MAKRAASAIIAGAGDSTGAALSRLFAEKGLAVHGARRRPPTTHDAAPLSLGSRGGSVTPVVACDFRDEEQVVYKRATTLTAEITFYSDCLVFFRIATPRFDVFRLPTLSLLARRRRPGRGARRARRGRERPGRARGAQHRRERALPRRRHVAARLPQDVRCGSSPRRSRDGYIIRVGRGAILTRHVIFR